MLDTKIIFPWVPAWLQPHPSPMGIQEGTFQRGLEEQMRSSRLAWAFLHPVESPAHLSLESSSPGALGLGSHLPWLAGSHTLGQGLPMLFKDLGLNEPGAFRL